MKNGGCQIICVHKNSDTLKKEDISFFVFCIYLVVTDAAATDIVLIILLAVVRYTITQDIFHFYSDSI